MEFAIWYVVVGGLLLLMVVGSSVLRRLPMTSSMLYLAVGFIMGPAVTGLFQPILFGPTDALLRLAEAVLVVSLFSAGLKLRVPLAHGRWQLSVRLAFLAMLLTVGLTALAAAYGLGLSLAPALLLGAILAPTDPVLAAEVQVTSPQDRDRVRFTLTGEAGLNDGTALPFALFAFGLMGLHHLGEYAWHWWAIDVAWAFVGGAGIGWLLGTLVGYLVLFVRRHYKEAVGLDDFLALGLIGLSYGSALLAGGSGFLAVFAAGLALRGLERDEAGGRSPEQVLAEAQAGEARKEEELATHPEAAPAYMAESLLGFCERVDRVGEVSMVVLVGGLLASVAPAMEAVWFIPLLFLVIRPASVFVSLIGSRSSFRQRVLIGWFGVRGIGSLYYLLLAAHEGVPLDLLRPIADLVLLTVAVSVVVHGVSVTPLMELYSRRGRRS